MISLLREYVECVLESSKLDPHNKGEDVELATSSRMAQDIEDDVFDMITKSYEKVGGNPKITTPASISTEYADEIVSDIDDDPEPDVVVLGQPKHGRFKISASATDGSPEAKQKVARIKGDLFKRGAWAEVSGAPAHIVMNKLHVPAVEDEARVRQLLGNKKITWYGVHPRGEFPGTSGWYSRKIGDKEHVKIIVGHV